jgi:hypothetical protein
MWYFFSFLSTLILVILLSFTWKICILFISWVTEPCHWWRILEFWNASIVFPSNSVFYFINIVCILIFKYNFSYLYATTLYYLYWKQLPHIVHVESNKPYFYIVDCCSKFLCHCKWCIRVAGAPAPPLTLESWWSCCPTCPTCGKWCCAPVSKV